MKRSTFNLSVTLRQNGVGPGFVRADAILPKGHDQWRRPVYSNRYLSQQLRCRGLTVICVPHTKVSEGKGERGTYGAVQFQLFAPESRDFLNIERSIVAMNDGGKWIFETIGEIQPFERVEKYKVKRIRDRFTNDLLEQYCLALGIRLFEAEFYGPSGVLIERLDHLQAGETALTLIEAKWRLGVED